MTNWQLELIKAYAPVFSDMALKEDKSKLDANIYKMLLHAQLILLGEFGSKDDVPNGLVGLAWTMDNNGEVVGDRWASRLCYASERMPNVTVEEIFSLANEFISIVRDWGKRK